MSYPGALALAATLLAAGSAPAARPSFLLFVLDTTRADAVSAYGKVARTTPAVDALAATGLRYARAYAGGSWTLPSHATLFTGLLPSQHGVSWRQTRASDALQTLAEALRAGGYETLGVSENPWITETFNLGQGFDRLVAAELGEQEVERVIDYFVDHRSGDRPFFVFVNVMDAHAPYETRAENPFLPPGVDAAAARRVSQDAAGYLCSREPRERDLLILRGLYLGSVAAADARLGAMQARLAAAARAEGLVTIVTADHGEHFGEHRLVQHLAGVREELIRVPLIVHGLPGVAPAVIEQAVHLADVMPSVLRWAGLPAPEGLAGVPLPTAASPAAPRPPVVSEWHDPDSPSASDENADAKHLRETTSQALRACRPDDRVHGDMTALVDYPLKLVRYRDHPPALYDLGADPGELHDLAPASPERVSKLTAELERQLAGAAPPRADPAASPPPAEVLERLRRLGYVSDGQDASAPPSTAVDAR